MDTMLIPSVILIFGVVGSIADDSKESIPKIKNDTEDSRAADFESLRNSLLNRERDFAFDGDFLNSPNLFQAQKFNGLSSVDAVSEDFSVFPTGAPPKVTENNQDPGTPGNNLVSSKSGAQSTQQSADSRVNSYSDEDQYSANADDSQVTTPYFDSFDQQSRFRVTPNKFSAHPGSMELTSSIPTYEVQVKSQVQQAPSNSLPYKTQFGYDKAGSKVYAPPHRYDQQQGVVDFTSYDRIFDNVDQFTTIPTVEIDSKKTTLPVLQLQSTPDFPGYIHSLETTPVIFSAESGLQYRSEPGFGHFDFADPNTNNQRRGSNLPFFGANQVPMQVLPVRAANSNAQFPRYKGASLSQFPNRDFTRVPNDYQEFKSQSQLHFDGTKKYKNQHRPRQLKKHREEIRSDVEIIQKKRPTPSPPKTDDEEEEEETETSADEASNEGFSGGDSFFSKHQNNDEDNTSGGKLKESDLESGFKPSTSYPFKEYDEKFGKYMKATVDTGEDDDEDVGVDLAAKYRFNDDDESIDDNLKYKSRASNEKYQNFDEDEAEEETREEQKKSNSKRKHRGPKKSKAYSDHDRSYEDEFADSYKKKSNKPKFAQYRFKGSTDSDEGRGRAHTNRKDKLHSRKGRYHVYRDESTDPSSRQPRYSANFEGNVNPQGPLKPIVASTKFPQISWQDSYGSSINKPDDEESHSFSSMEELSGGIYADENKPSGKSPQEETTRAPYKTSTIPAKQVLRTYVPVSTSTFSPRGIWKSSGLPLGNSFRRPLGSNLRSLVNPKQSFYPDFGRGEISRNLKGI